MLRKWKLLKNEILFTDNSRIITYCKHKYIQKYSQKAEPLQCTYPRRIFSGIQPTGTIHLGNFLGAIQRWVELQNSSEQVLLSIADMHSITLPQNPKMLKENILKVTATLLACGIDPKKSILFQQSDISMHAELCWILGCITTMTRLKHLPQFKEKSQSLKNIPLGIYIYPVLQAADILLYRATHIPIGQDQAQHIQLAQDLARIFNNNFGKTFPIPHCLIKDDLSQSIKSLRDPLKKMSKSDKDPKSRINLEDDPDVLLEKIKKAITDCTSKVTYEPETRPGVANLITIHSLLTGKTPKNICNEVDDLDTGMYKLLVADVVIEKLTPIREQLIRLNNEPLYLEEILKEGKEKAMQIGTECWSDVRTKVGFKTSAYLNNENAENVAQKL